jgi:hypothetical protein
MGTAPAAWGPRRGPIQRAVARAGRLDDVGELKAGIRKGHNPIFKAHLVGLRGEQPLQVELQQLQQLQQLVPLPRRARDDARVAEDVTWGCSK